MKFILQIYVNRIWVVNTILHWLYNDILLLRLGTIGLFMVCFIWVTNINRMCMLKVISLDLLFLIRFQFPLDKSITYVLRSRYGNLVVKELTEIWEGWLFLTKMQVTLNISNSMSIENRNCQSNYRTNQWGFRRSCWGKGLHRRLRRHHQRNILTNIGWIQRVNWEKPRTRSHLLGL